MTISSQASGGNIVVLAAQLSIAQVEALHVDLKRHVASGNALIFDGARVEQIDTAALQLLASVWQTCQQRGTACSWKIASEALKRSAALIGVADMLSLVSV